jgi:hypothetical protein
VKEGMNKKHEEMKDQKIFLITFRKVEGAPVIAIKWNVYTVCENITPGLPTRRCPEPAGDLDGPQTPRQEVRPP